MGLDSRDIWEIIYPFNSGLKLLFVATFVITSIVALSLFELSLGYFLELFQFYCQLSLFYLGTSIMIFWLQNRRTKKQEIKVRMK